MKIKTFLKKINKYARTKIKEKFPEYITFQISFVIFSVDFSLSKIAIKYNIDESTIQEIVKTVCNHVKCLQDKYTHRRIFNTEGKEM